MTKHNQPMTLMEMLIAIAIGGTIVAVCITTFSVTNVDEKPQMPPIKTPDWRQFEEKLPEPPKSEFEKFTEEIK